IQVLDGRQVGSNCFFCSPNYSLISVFYGVNERTFLAIKPDGVQRHLVGEIIRRFEKKVLENRGDMIAVFQYLRGCHREEEGVKLFSKAPIGQTRNNGWKLIKERFNLEIRRNFLIVRTINPWNRSCPWKLWEHHHLRLSRRDWTAICQKWCRVSAWVGVGLDDLQGPFQL
uniref:Nucleoside diphosphate kinase-like domain-containing protein n=1 Tax=Naja naja TaxID=35670 RepID=A0A8C6XQS9_NAJNA